MSKLAEAWKDRQLTPLAIIALFISLSEVIAGIAAITTSGTVQVLFALFAIGFPILAGILFFWILWHRPWVFYHPTEYGNETDVSTFVEAMQRGFPKVAELDKQIEQTVKKVLTSDNVVNNLLSSISTKDNDIQPRVEEILRKTAEDVVISVRHSSFLTIDSKPILGSNGKLMSVPYTQFESIGLLLRYIWSEIEILPIHTYTTDWILIDLETNRIFDDIGSRYARKHLGSKWDNRSLKEVGIHPGSTLGVIRPNGVTRRRRNA
jgi:hypothetical protein